MYIMLEDTSAINILKELDLATLIKIINDILTKIVKHNDNIKTNLITRFDSKSIPNINIKFTFSYSFSIASCIP